MLRLLVLLTVSLASLGSARCERPAIPVEARLVSRAGFVEPHTPGAGAALEIPASEAVETLLGAEPDLNRVTTLRFRRAGPAPRPRAVLILVPGFLGSAGSLAPLGRDVTAESGGLIEVWIVDRRSNVLEDRLGARHAQGALSSAGPADRERLLEGFQFYFPDADVARGSFPGPGDTDIDGDGVLDPPTTLVDRFGVERGFVRLVQDDARFMAHWGIDTYARDWRRLVREARRRVGPRGLVLFGGHSMGTAWTGLYAAYDFDPGGGVDAAHEELDGLVLLEGGGPGPPAVTTPTRDEYLASVTALETPGGPDVFLEDAFTIPPDLLGAAAELSAAAALAFPDEPALIQRSPLFASGSLALLFQTAFSNESVFAFFIDDDFQPVAAFRASVGFSVDGPNFYQVAGLFGGPPFYLTGPASSGPLRSWLDYDDPSLPSCPPAELISPPGCAIAPGQREVTDLRELYRVQTGAANFIEWYFVSGRVNLDFAYGRDASALADESLNGVTQNAAVDVPVLAIGGSNGLTPVPASFAGYLGSIATPAEQQEIHILDGYAHLDVGLAAQNETAGVIVDWVGRRLLEKRGWRCPRRPLAGTLLGRLCSSD